MMRVDMAKLLDALAGAPYANDLDGVRQNLRAGYYAGKGADLSGDLLALYPEGHEARERIVDLAAQAAEGEFDDEQQDAADAHELAQLDAATAPVAPPPSPEPEPAPEQ